MISEHSAHSTPLPFGIRTWLWRYICLLLLISMLWHRQAIFESKGDKLSSSAESRIRTHQGLRHMKCLVICKYEKEIYINFLIISCWRTCLFFMLVWSYQHTTSGLHDDVIQWKHFPRYWPFLRGIHRSPVNSPHKGQWRRALMFFFICARINGWVNNREAGDLRCYRTHYDVIVMGTDTVLLSLGQYLPSVGIWHVRREKSKMLLLEIPNLFHVCVRDIRVY